MLQEELAGTENKISYARQSYNNAVMDYHVARQKFPANLIATYLILKKRNSLL